MTFAEFKDAVHIGGTRAPFKNARTGQKVHVAPSDASALPASVDWTTAGAVTPVKNQGNCGSCWSFSATGSIEGAYEIKYNNLQSFSEQELVSCDTTDAGCNGGWMDDAFAWAQKNGGLTTEAAYPYTSGTSGTSGTCKTTGYTNNANAAPKGWVDVTAGSVDALMSALVLTPSPLPSRPTSLLSRPTSLVSSPATAARDSTTVSLQLDTEPGPMALPTGR